MDGLLLDCVDLQGIQLLVKHLAEIHHYTLVDLLPEMGPEYLDEGDLEGRDLAVHEYPSQVKLHLETHIHLQRERESVRERERGRERERERERESQ